MPRWSESRATARLNAAARAILGIELDAPPDCRGLEDVTGLLGRGPTRPTQLGIHLIETGIVYELVDAKERILPAKRCGPSGLERRGGHRGH
jgi:hypothetical protein